MGSTSYDSLWREPPDGSWRLDQRDFCGEIAQVREEGRHSDMTSQEMTQCRAVLGAIQWRVYQTGPQHSAKLGHLQSIISKGDRSTIAEVNKLVREVHAQRDVGLVIHQLCAERDEDLVLVAWSDAALANRPDLSSTGGYIIGFVHKDMVDQGVRGPVNVMSWSSSKLKRVCRSSLAAETQALAECEQELMFLRVQWAEMLGYMTSSWMSLLKHQQKCLEFWSLTQKPSTMLPRMVRSKRAPFP